MFGSNQPVTVHHPTDRPNFTEVRIGPVDLFFSYSTIVAFRAPAFGRVVSENVWSQTTGKHLNWIDGGDKGGRFQHERFTELLDQMVGQLSIDYQEGVKP